MGRKRKEQGEGRSLPGAVSSPLLQVGPGKEHGAVASWLVHGVRHNVLLLAEALDSSNWGKYAMLRRHLLAMSKARGNAVQRTTHVMLEALELRREGRGFQTWNTLLQCRPIDSRNSLLWYATAHPAVLFNALASIGMLLPMIVGKPWVHLICFGWSLVSQVSVLFKLLAGTQSATSSATIQRLRVTFISALPLCRPGCTDYSSIFELDSVGPHLIREASSLGLDLRFQVLTMKEDTLDSLDQLVRSHDVRETVAVANAIEFQSISDDPALGGGPLQRVMKTLAAPVVVAFVEPEVDTSRHSFTTRFQEYVDHTWAVLSSNDECSKSNRKGTKWVHLVEQIYYFPNVFGVVACDGRERRLRPWPGHAWQSIFEFWGFTMMHPTQSFLTSLADFVSSFPQRFSVLQKHGFSYLMWEDAPLAVACAFEFKEDRKTLS